MCGKNLSFTSYVEIGFVGGAYRNMGSVVSYVVAIIQPMVATLDQIKPLRKYFKQLSIRPCSLRI